MLSSYQIILLLGVLLLMSVTVVGASGCIGARVVALLLKSGFLVRGVVFRPDSLLHVERMGCECVVGNVLQKHTLYNSFDSSDLIINATTSFAVDQARSIFTRDVASSGMVNVAEVARDCNAPLITTSLLSDVATGGFFDENEERFSEGESGARKVFEELRKRHVVMRFPLLYSGDSLFFQHLAAILQTGKLSLNGNGDNIIPLIHSDDAASAVVQVALDILNSKYPVTSVNQSKVYHAIPKSHFSTQAALLATLAATIGAPKLLKPFFPRPFPPGMSATKEVVAVKFFLFFLF